MAENRNVSDKLVAVMFACGVFLSAFLLFQVQPLIVKFILPWFGGSPEVWTTCMLFFQLFLLAGYAYAHILIKYFNRSVQVMVHAAILIGACITLPIIPSETMKPTGLENPTVYIIMILAMTVGLSYFILASTGPLLQGWFSRILPDESPYWLYSLSNAGSFLALLSYPFVFEPNFTRQQQAYFWGYGLIVFMVVCILCSMLFRVHAITPADPVKYQKDSKDNHWLRWLILPAGGSVVLLAVTNKICQDITVIPFFWVLPLSLYLLTFVICFNSHRWYKRQLWSVIFILSFILLAATQAKALNIPTWAYITIHSIALFSCCMVFHGELYRIRPHSSNLTGYYLMISAGGAAGGFFVVVIAPVIFNTYMELYLSLVGCCLYILMTDKTISAQSRSRRIIWPGTVIIACGLGYLLQSNILGIHGKQLASRRNFFGILSVLEKDADNPSLHRLVMQHGNTNHGVQYTDPAMHDKPMAYFTEQSGIGILMRNYPKQNRRVGIVGLGVGSIAAYGNTGDYFTYYEINPEVLRQAEKYFTYLKNSKAEVDVKIGDARLTLERQPSRQFDILVLDAFTSDAIPVHLLTTQAFEIYLNHLKKDGVLALHFSSMHLDLQPVVRKLASYFGMKSVWIESYDNPAIGQLAADWLIMSKDTGFLESSPIKSTQTVYDRNLDSIKLWTDDYINLFDALKKD